MSKEDKAFIAEVRNYWLAADGQNYNEAWIMLHSCAGVD